MLHFVGTICANRQLFGVFCLALISEFVHHVATIRNSKEEKKKRRKEEKKVEYHQGAGKERKEERNNEKRSFPCVRMLFEVKETNGLI